MQQSRSGGQTCTTEESFAENPKH